MTFEEATATKIELELACAHASAALDSYSEGAGYLGLHSDAVKSTPAWKSARVAFLLALGRLRKFNGWYVKEFAEQIRAQRRARTR